MKRLLMIFATALFAAVTLQAQPAKRRVVTSKDSKDDGKERPSAKGDTEKKSDRATLMFPTSASMPEDVVWRRDIYRQLDLLKDANAPLYYPVEPHGKEQNLFTYLLRLFLSGRISVYKYSLDGEVSFEASKKLNARDMLENFRIYFEEEGGRYNVAESDIPSASVKSFYVKESSYFDQRSATYKTRVTALCPILFDDSEFESIDNDGSSAIQKPMFWVKYDDVAVYLSRMPIMASNLNNVTNMTVDDYFTMNRYDGKIYKTNNLQGRVLPNDSTRVKEQERIEQQLKDFEEHIWHYEAPQDSLDSIAVNKDEKKVVRSQRDNKPAAKDEKVEKKTNEGKSAKQSSNRRSSAAAKAPKTSSAPRVSARRQRR